MMAKQITLIKYFLKFFISCFITSSLPLFIANVVDGQEYCISESCQLAAKTLEASANFKIDPCSDFYSYACGGSGRALMNKASELVQNNRGSLVRDSRSYRSPGLEALRTFHTSCVERNDQSDSFLIDLIGKYRPNIDSIKFESLLSSLQTSGFTNQLMDIEFTFMKPDTSRILVQLSPRSFKKTNFSLLISKLSRDPLELGEINISEAQGLYNMLREFISDQVLKNSTKQVITLAELSSQWAPAINWTLLLGEIGSRRIPSLDQQIIVENVYYFQRISDFVKNASSRVLNTMILLRAIDEAATYSGRSLEQAASRRHSGLCMDILTSQLGFLYSREYSQFFVSDERINRANEMFSHLEDELSGKLNRADWIADSETKRLAKSKLAAIRMIASLPKEILDYNFIEQLYGLDKFRKESYLSNILTITKNLFNYDSQLLGSDYRKLAWIKFQDSMSINAMYEDAFNSISLLAGQLNDYHMDENRPMYLNFGLTGSILAHEIIHAFDPAGIVLDDKGQLRIWWDESSAKNYSDKLTGVVNLYSNLKIPSTFRVVNATRTLNENLADLVGFGAARLAYERYLNKLDKIGLEIEKQRLSGSTEQIKKLNGRQVFWLSFASGWCNNLSPRDEAQQADNDHHSPARFRVNVPLQNNQQFAEDFNCPSGSPMNPSHKFQFV